MSRKSSLSIKMLNAAVIAALLGSTSAMAAVPATGDKVGGLITVKTGAAFPSIASDAAGDIIANNAESCGQLRLAFIA